MKKIIITIDGYAGSGKSSTAKEVARRLKYKYLNSGAIYRSISYFLLENKVDYNERNILLETINKINFDYNFNEKTGSFSILLNEENVTYRLYTEDIENVVSKISLIPEIRNKVVQFQKNINTDQGLIAEGRDMGTVIFPKANLKIFMTADINIRARRRLKDLDLDIKNLESMKLSLEQRDKLDISRSISPLKKSENAIIIDNTDLDFEQTVSFILDKANKLIFV